MNVTITIDIWCIFHLSHRKPLRRRTAFKQHTRSHFLPCYPSLTEINSPVYLKSQQCLQWDLTFKGKTVLSHVISKCNYLSSLNNGMYFAALNKNMKYLNFFSPQGGKQCPKMLTKNIFTFLNDMNDDHWPCFNKNQ